MVEFIQTSVGVVVGIAWTIAGIVGMIQIIKKGYLPNMSFGCWLMLVLGIWLVPLLLLPGPIWLVIAHQLEAKKACPFCKSMILESAKRCAHCSADL